MKGINILRMRNTVGGGAAPLSTQWRVQIREVIGVNNVPIAREVEMRGAIGGSDLCTGGTAAASHQVVGGEPEDAFDDNTTTFWQSSIKVTTPQWLSYTFLSAVTIVQISWQIHTSTNDGIEDFDIQYWDGASWVTYWSIDNATWSSSDQVQVFAKP